MTNENAKEPSATPRRPKKPIPRPLTPPVTIDGRPLLFVKIEGSALMSSAVPASITWSQAAALPYVHHLLRPTDDWLDRTWDDEHLATAGLSQDALQRYGAPAIPVSHAARKAVKGTCLVMQHPGLERQWLTELLVLAPGDICFESISLAKLATDLAVKVGISDEAVARLAVNIWLRLIMHEQSELWGVMPRILIQSILDRAVRRGLIDPAKPIRLNSRRRSVRSARKSNQP